MRAGFNKRRNTIYRDRIIFLCGGVICFAGAVVFATVFFGQQEVEAHQNYTAAEPSPDQVYFGTVQLLAPIAPIAVGTKLSDVELRPIYWPRTKVPQGAIRPGSDISDMYAKAVLPANQPILKGNLTPYPTQGGLADIIPHGHRAITIEVTATTGVEGWIRPGARVDVLVAYHDHADGTDKAQIVVEDAIVVSYNGQIENNNGASSHTAQAIASTATVTLGVPIRDALKINTATTMGVLSLLLRHTHDTRSVGNINVSSREVANAKRKKRHSGGDAVGFVRYTDDSGNATELELRKDNRWWKVENDF